MRSHEPAGTVSQVHSVCFYSHYVHVTLNIFCAVYVSQFFSFNMKTSST